jgi:hypothetical protein
MNDRKGEPMYKGLQSVVEILLGKEFNQKLQTNGKQYIPKTKKQK